MNLFVYFGFSLMSVTLAGNKYINFMLIALVEIPAYVSMWIGMEYCNLGRKTALELASFVAAVPCLIYLFVPDGNICIFHILYMKCSQFSVRFHPWFGYHNL